MQIKSLVILLLPFLMLIFCVCNQPKESAMKFSGVPGEVKLITVDPGHFHTGLVQKVVYPQVDSTAYVYAPKGPDVADHLNRVNSYNTRAENPTNWNEKVYLGDDFLEKMLEEKPGNVVVLAGKNQKKMDYIQAAVDAGLNVLADKPMCLNKAEFNRLKSVFDSAEKNDVLLYDIMTERYEITTILQKVLANNPAVFGELIAGTPEKPAVTKESVHHFFKYVSGAPIKRPAWFFDVEQQGEGIVDVTTHLVDLIQWECFPEQVIDYKSDIEMLEANRWPTLLDLNQFAKVTRLTEYPEYLKKILNKDNLLEVFANGDMIYKIKGIHAKVSVIWNFEAPEGTGDTHFSIMRGTKAGIAIKQGKEQNFKPELYVLVPEPGNQKEVEDALEIAISGLQTDYPGLAVKAVTDGWQILIPDEFRNGHEAHFGQVTEKYLQFLIDGKLPDWEVPNMIAKYFTTTEALEKATH